MVILRWHARRLGGKWIAQCTLRLSLDNKKSETLNRFATLGTRKEDIRKGSSVLANVPTEEWDLTGTLERCLNRGLVSQIQSLTLLAMSAT